MVKFCPNTLPATPYQVFKFQLLHLYQPIILPYMNTIYSNLLKYPKYPSNSKNAPFYQKQTIFSQGIKMTKKLAVLGGGKEESRKI